MLTLACAVSSFSLPPGLQQETSSRRAALVSGASLAAAVFAPPRARADVPTYSLKGVPGLTTNVKGFGESEVVTSEKSGFSLGGLLGGGDAPPPADLGVIGRGQNRDKTGRLNKCEGGKKGCISTFDEPDAESYIPPWTYQPGYSTQAISANDARRQALREQAGIEANGGIAPPKPATKSREEAYAELKVAIGANGGKIVAEEDRYIRAEFVEGGVTDDVEWLLSLDAPIAGYRSAAVSREPQNFEPRSMCSRARV